MPLYRRRPGGVWWVRIGRRTRKSSGTTDRAKAQEFERLLTERLWRREKLQDRSTISFREAAERWLSDSKKARRRDQEILKWLTPRIGEHPVSSVADPDAIEALRVFALARGCSHSTVDRAMRTVRAILRACVRWRCLEYAPHVPMYRQPEEEPHWLTREEFERLCEHLPRHLELAARFAVLTLLRMRSQGQLTWDRVDLEVARAWIPRGHMKGGKTFGFPLSREAVRILRELRVLNPRGNAVFQWRGRQQQDFNTRAFQEAVRAAGLEPLRWHDLRHTGASWAVQAGVTLQELMVLGDWRSYSMVLRYAHFAPSHAATAAEKMAQWAHIRGADGAPAEGEK